MEKVTKCKNFFKKRGRFCIKIVDKAGKNSL